MVTNRETIRDLSDKAAVLNHELMALRESISPQPHSPDLDGDAQAAWQLLNEAQACARKVVMILDGIREPATQRPATSPSMQAELERAAHFFQHTDDVPAQLTIPWSSPDADVIGDVKAAMAVAEEDEPFRSGGVKPGE